MTVIAVKHWFLNRAFLGCHLSSQERQVVRKNIGDGKECICHTRLTYREQRTHAQLYIGPNRWIQFVNRHVASKSIQLADPLLAQLFRTVIKILFVNFQLIIVLSSINLILPTLTIYSLSMSDFGRHLEKVIAIKVFYQLLQLCIINIPFLGVRIYLW